MNIPFSEVKLTKAQLREALELYFNAQVFKTPVKIASLDITSYGSTVEVTFVAAEDQEAA